MESHVSSFISAVNVMNDLSTSLFRRHFTIDRQQAISARPWRQSFGPRLADFKTLEPLED
jgi:hypothetical protein